MKKLVIAVNSALLLLSVGALSAAEMGDIKQCMYECAVKHEAAVNWCIANDDSNSCLNNAGEARAQCEKNNCGQ